MHETPTRLDALCEAAAVEMGKTVTKDEARLQADYDLTLREITKRLKAERAAQSGGPQFIAAAATPTPSSAAVNCGPPADGEEASK